IEHGRHVPLLVKLSPDLTDEDLTATARIIASLGIEGVIATNTTIRRPGLDGHPLAGEQGGLSGTPLLELSLGAVRRLRAELGARVVIIGVGGIDSVPAARAMLAAGADLIQVYTGLVYRGPRLVRELASL
ncbi:MAG TPA: quinone-dependent dihydroorotate dehydrogenase, partial [Steroidobacteraceae bacterium]